MPPEQRGELHVQRVLGAHRVGEVRAVEARDEHPRVRQPQLLEDVAAHPLGGGRGERDEGSAGEGVAELAEVAVVGAELVPPLRDAVRLVDGDERRVRLGQEAAEPGHGETLRRDVQQLRPPLEDAALRVGGLLRRERAVDVARADAVRVQRVHLVLHQRDQRRDDERGPVEHQRGELVAERLPAAGGHQREAVLPVEDVRDDVLLHRAEPVVAEAVFQELAGCGELVHSAAHSSRAAPSGQRANVTRADLPHGVGER